MYLTVDYRNFNKGKQKECEDRVKHTKYTKLRYDAYDDLKIKQTKLRYDAYDDLKIKQTK